MFCSCSTKFFWFICFLSFPVVCCCCLRDFCARSSRGKKEEEEVEERKEFVWCKEESGREVGR